MRLCRRRLEGWRKITGLFAETTIAAAGTAATEFQPEDEGFVSGVGAIVMIAGAGNAAQVITGFDPGTPPMVTLAAAQTWADGAAVTSGIPDPSYGTERARLYGTDGSISFDGGATTIDDVAHTGGSFTYNNGHTLYEIRRFYAGSQRHGSRRRSSRHGGAQF